MSEQVIDDAQAFRRGRDRGAEWLVGRQQADGALKPEDNSVASYFKVPWALANSGQGSAGKALAAWIRDNALTAEGDFAGTAGRGTQEANATYSNAWITLGTHRLGAYDVSYPAIRRILELRTPAGGFYRVRPETRVADGSGAGTDIYASGAVPATTDLLSTAMSGLACLALGETEAATGAGEHLLCMWAAQPELPTRVYFQWHDEGELLTDAPAEAAANFCVDAGSERQRYFQVGITAAFLAKLYEVTRRQEYLDVARSALDATTTFAADRYATPQSGKVGWGAAYVYRLTGEERYRDIARQVGRGLIALQSESGCWGGDEEPLDRRLELTGEFVALLGEIEEAVA